MKVANMGRGLIACVTVIETSLRHISLIYSLVVPAIFAISSPAFSDTDLEVCYGDRVDVVLNSVVTYDDDVGLQVFQQMQLALPNPNGWLIRVRGYDSLLHDLPCLEEPIPVASIWGGFMDRRLGHGVMSVPNVDGVHVRSVRISGVGTEVAGERERRRVNLIIGREHVVEQGFRRRFDGDDAFLSPWIFPSSYLSPIDTQVIMSCNLPTCRIEYHLARSLRINYEIWLDGPTAVWTCRGLMPLL